MTNITFKAPAVAPQCPYCDKSSVLLPTSETIYRGRDFGPIYICEPCQAWVGAHRDTLRPMGRLANAELRAKKIEVHRVFDPLWRDLHAAYPDMPVIPRYLMRRARSRAYLWLAHHLTLHQDQCHIGFFDEALCQRAIDVIVAKNATSGTVREWIKNFDKEPA